MGVRSDQASDDTRADRFLERVLCINFLVHAWGLLAMVAFLIRTLPGGTAATDIERMATIAAHPWLFRACWLPWQLCALFDLLLSIALLRARWVPRLVAVAAVVVTVLAVVPDQYAEVAWITRGVALAQGGDLESYLVFERAIFPYTAGFGALGYTAAALCWTAAFARAGAWSRLLTVVSVGAWALMFVASMSALVPDAIKPSPRALAGINAAGFALLQLWLALVTEQVLRRARPTTTFGRWAQWRHPSPRLWARALDVIANSRFVSVFTEPFPELSMRSDITDVLYVSWLIPSERAAAWLPPGLELQRLGPDGAYTLFTFLTYRHGHFGFAFLGPLRRFMPSPIQTNWRLHVRSAAHGEAGITFLTNAVTHAAPALAARLTTEGMPMHIFQHAAHDTTRSADGHVAYRTTLDPGTGTAPDAELLLTPCAAPVLTGAWQACFADWHAFLAFCVPQDRALSSQPWKARVSRQEIALGIPLDACTPLTGTVTSRAAAAITGGDAGAPLCFHVAKVGFRFSTEAHDAVS